MIFILSILVIFSFTISLNAQDKPLDAIEILQKSNLNINQKTLDAGKIITLARQDLELTDTSIAISMALYVKAPYEKVLEDIKASDNALSSYPGAMLVNIKDSKK